MAGIGQRFVLIYALVLTGVVTMMVLTGAATPKNPTFDEITVQRINVVEPDGTLRMVIADHAKLPGVIVRGKEQLPADRPQAGMLFYNDEASENGGLIFGGHRNAKGEVVDSGGSLSFDKYDANQIVQLAGVDDKEDRFSGVIVSDSVAAGATHRRIWVGRGDNGAAVVQLMDAQGRKRISMEVAADGTPRLSFLDAAGKIVNEIVPEKSE